MESFYNEPVPEQLATENNGFKSLTVKDYKLTENIEPLLMFFVNKLQVIAGINTKK